MANELIFLSIMENKMNTQTPSKSTKTFQTNTALRLVVGVLLSLLSGVMLTMAFAPYNAWPLVFVAFLPLILAQLSYHACQAFSSLAPAVFMAGIWVYLYFGPSFFPGGIMLALPAIVFCHQLTVLRKKLALTSMKQTHYRWFII